MLFSIDFNRNTNDEVLKELNCYPEYINNGELCEYFKNLDGFNDLELLQKQLNEIMTKKKGKNTYYSLIVNIEEGNNSVYFDDKC